MVGGSEGEIGAGDARAPLLPLGEAVAKIFDHAGHDGYDNDDHDDHGDNDVGDVLCVPNVFQHFPFFFLNV